MMPETRYSSLMQFQILAEFSEVGAGGYSQRAEGKEDEESFHDRMGRMEAGAGPRDMKQIGWRL